MDQVCLSTTLYLSTKLSVFTYVAAPIPPPLFSFPLYTGALHPLW